MAEEHSFGHGNFDSNDGSNYKFNHGGFGQGFSNTLSRSSDALSKINIPDDQLDDIVNEYINQAIQKLISDPEEILKQILKSKVGISQTPGLGTGIIPAPLGENFSVANLTAANLSYALGGLGRALGSMVEHLPPSDEPIQLGDITLGSPAQPFVNPLGTQYKEVATITNLNSNKPTINKPQVKQNTIKQDTEIQNSKVPTAKAPITTTTVKSPSTTTTGVKAPSTTIMGGKTSTTATTGVKATPTATAKTNKDKADKGNTEDNMQKKYKHAIKALNQADIDKITQSIPNQYTDLQSFLSQYTAETIINEKGKKETVSFTHTSMGGGSYDIPTAEMETLYRLLEKSLAKTSVHLTEKPTDPCPLKVDLDFRFDLEDIRRKYTINHILGMVKLYNEVIAEYVDIDPDEINAYVFERSEPYKFKGNLKDGIHIIYPEVMVDTTIQQVIRDVVIGRCAEVLGDLPLKNSYTEVVDLAVIAKNNWLMYGCCKPGLPPYVLSRVYNYYMKEDTDLSKYTMGFLIRHLSNFNRNKPVYYVKDDPVIQDKYTEKSKQNAEKQEKKKVVRQELTRNFILTKKKYRSKCSDSLLQEAQQLTGVLQTYRADNYHDWVEVGWCLHNIDESLLDTWIKFSKKSSKYEDGECERKWITFRDEGLSVGSLHRWAKMDNPEKYAEIVRESISGYILKSVTCTTYDVARVVYELYKYQYKCVNVKHNTWYEFKSHKWHEIDSAIGLKKKISNDVLNEYLHLVGYYNNNAIIQHDENKDQFLVKSKALTDVTYKLRDYTFKEKVLKECITFFYDEYFFQKLDVNPYLIGFENGVYDLKKAEFRDGRPEDYISVSTGNDYMEFDQDDDAICEIYTFMSQIFTNADVREYVFVLFASFLLGQNVEQKFHIFTGGGGNGKSCLIDLFEMSFGEYCCKLPITLLTQKRPASGAPNPELARARAARFASMQEPDEHERLNIGYMKELTGGDKIMVRGLFKEPFEFKPRFKLALCCNHLPKVPPNDEGSWRRLRVVEFLSRFRDRPNPNEPLEFQKDEYLSDKMHGWKEAFMFLLIQYFKKYQTEGIVEPAEVLKATRDYQKTCDIYVEFIDDTLEKKDGCVIKIDEMYHAFRVWYRDSFDGKCPSKKDFKDGASKRLGKYQMGRNSGWHGWRLIAQIEGEEAEAEPEIEGESNGDGDSNGDGESNGDEDVDTKPMPKIIKKEQLATPKIIVNKLGEEKEKPKIQKALKPILPKVQVG